MVVQIHSIVIKCLSFYCLTEDFYLAHCLLVGTCQFLIVILICTITFLFHLIKACYFPDTARNSVEMYYDLIDQHIISGFKNIWTYPESFSYDILEDSKQLQQFSNYCFLCSFAVIPGNVISKILQFWVKNNHMAEDNGQSNHLNLGLSTIIKYTPFVNWDFKRFRLEKSRDSIF